MGHLLFINANDKRTGGWSGGIFPDAVGSAMMGIFATLTRELCRRAYKRSWLRGYAAMVWGYYLLELFSSHRIREPSLEVSRRGQLVIVQIGRAHV